MQRQNAFFLSSKDYQISDEDFSYPYTVSVTVEHAENLMICDKVTGTSDPYVTLACNDKVFGTTKVVPLNRCPKWTEAFEIHLLSLRQELTLRIFDSNDFRDNVAMGIVVENLHSAYESMEDSDDSAYLVTRSVKRPDDPEIEGEGTLTFSLRFQVLLAVIKVLSS